MKGIEGGVYLKKILSFFILAVMLTIFGSSTLYASTNDIQAKKELENKILNEKASEEEYIVKFKQNVSEDVKETKLSGFSTNALGNDKLGIIKISGKNASGQTIEDFKAKNSGDIEYIIPNYKRKAFLTPNDTYFNDQWNLKKICIEDGWNYTTGSSDITVAVIDSGLDINNVDATHNLVSGYNFILNNNDIYDASGHGTFVSGIIGATTNNSIGVAGVDWNVKIMPLQVMYSDGTCYDSDVINAITYAVDHGAKIINLSLGGTNSNPAMQSTIDYAVSHNVTVVAAAGNNGNSTVNYPAAFNGVIGVGSTNYYDTRSDFSPVNYSVDVTAPGEDIISTAPTESGYGIGSGTSYSSPEVAGVAALLLTINPNLTPAQITNILESTSDDLGTAGRDDEYGYGRINAKKAIESLLKPVGYIETLTNNQELSGIVNIAGWCLDIRYISKIEILSDGKVIGNTKIGGSREDVAAAYPFYRKTGSGFNYQLYTRGLTNGSHVISVRETDGDGVQTVIASVTVQVNNKSAFGYIETISDSQQISGTVNLNGWYLDYNGSILKLEILLDGVVIGETATGITRPDVAAAYPDNPYSGGSGFRYQIDTHQIPNGTHVITVKETNTDGAQSTLPVTVTVNNKDIFGYVDTLSENQQLTGTVIVGGWLLDINGVSKIEVFVDGNISGLASTGIAREDVAAAYPQYNNKNSGFYYELNTRNLGNGAHVISVRETSNNNIQTIIPPVKVTISNSNVIGYVDTLTNNQQLTGTVNVGGWFLDFYKVSKIEILVDGEVKGTAVTGGLRKDVYTAYPEYQNQNSGFSYQLNTKELSNGTHNITVRETGSTNVQTSLPQIKVIINNLGVIGYVDTILNNQQVSNTVSVGGWLLDNYGVSKIEILVDGKAVGIATTGSTREDVAAAYPQYNQKNSGFHYTLDTTLLTNGNHTIIVAETSKDGSQNTLTPLTIAVNNKAAIGYIDSLTDNQQVGGIVNVNGWAIDYNAVSYIQIYVDGIVNGVAVYGYERSDVAAAYPEYNNKNSGFSYSLDTKSLSNGSHVITAMETNTKNIKSSLHSVTINVSNLTSIGYVDSSFSGKELVGNVNISGWYLDLSGVKQIDVLVDGNYFGTAVYGDLRTDVQTAYPQYKNANSGFHYTMDTARLSAGVHSIVITETGYNGVQTTMPAISVNVAAQALGTWTTNVSMPTPRYYLGAIAYDGKIYAIGGGGQTAGHTVEVYDIATNSWSSKTPATDRRFRLTPLLVNGKIYVVGEKVSVVNGVEAGVKDVIEEYDPLTNTWKYLSDIRTQRSEAGVTTINGKIYIIGGSYNGVLNTVEEYDPSTNLWTTKASMPTARYGLKAVVLNNKILAIGGRVSNTDLSVIEEYDPTTDQWTTRNPMPVSENNFGATVVNNKLYVIGGFFSNRVEEYNPISNTWRALTNMPTARYYFGIAENSGKIYIVGGDSGGAIGNLEVFTPPAN